MQDWKSRIRRIVGDEGLLLLNNANVAVFGLGGVGSACAEALVRGGIGNISVIDRDVVSASNINRQVIAFQSTIGQRKVDVMRNMALDINPEINVTTYYGFVNRENVAEVFSKIPEPHFVVDALDTLTCKVAIAKYCEKNNISSLHAGGSANRLDPLKLEFADLFSTEVCPLCRELRKIARVEGVTRMEMLYSKERAQKVLPEQGAERKEKTELGSMSYMPPIMGQVLASYVIRQILNI